MSIDRFCLAVVAGAGLCGAAMALTPSAAAAPLPTGGPSCIEQLAGVGALPMPAAPVVLPGPPVAGAVPLAPVIPAVPPVVPPVPVAPVGAPPAPVAPPAAPVVPAAGAAAPPAAGPAAAPVNKAAGAGKGAPAGPALTFDPLILPGPPPPAPAPAPIPAVLAGTTAALPACGAAGPHPQ
ncbi:hypothetical protein [Mycobacterium kubicae]|uniref:Beta-xylosidase n=2 Tax=Mycobacterium kubicae TaxID=120959 RepID=A0AAX1JFI2_9MYCO|nr:hypothetical protein [Mycobacterium kubicae]MCV7096439.1 hypothetical protein [Mycobacterium kubicae]OBK48612.1 hypothetical protein A5657_23030 [Mycobacterium kubicae]ORW05242.1 hypothetical protein AWC13_26460 [Mycobacterium kubicae]QPI39162.1 hypothetical protein I2456_06635 [Mycobacterium kubicae]